MNWDHEKIRFLSIYNSRREQWLVACDDYDILLIFFFCYSFINSRKHFGIVQILKIIILLGVLFSFNDLCVCCVSKLGFFFRLIFSMNVLLIFLPFRLFLFFLHKLMSIHWKWQCYISLPAVSYLLLLLLLLLNASYKY